MIGDLQLLHRNLADNLAYLNQVAAFWQVQGKTLVVAVNADSSDLGACQVEDFHYLTICTNNMNIAAIDGECNVGNAHLNAVTLCLSLHGNGCKGHCQSECYDENLLHSVYNLVQRYNFFSIPASVFYEKMTF